MKLTKDTEHLLQVGDILKYDNGFECTVKSIEPSVINPANLFISVSAQNEKEETVHTMWSCQLYNGEIISKSNLAKRYMESKIEAVKKILEAMSMDLEKMIQGNSDNMPSLTISYNNLSVDIPTDYPETYEGIEYALGEIQESLKIIIEDYLD